MAYLKEHLISGPSWLSLCFIAVGGCLGGFHFGYDNILPESLLLFSIVVALSFFRIQWGACLLIGLVAGDFFFYRLPHVFQVSQEYYRSVLQRWMRATGFGVSSLIYYYLMALVCYKIPQFCREISRLPTSSPTIQWIVNVCASAVLVYFWTLAYPVLIRPLWTWTMTIPPVSAIEPVQKNGYWVVLAVIVAGVIREWHRRRLGKVGLEEKIAIEHIHVSPFIFSKRARIILQSVFGTFILSGLLTTWWDTLIVLGILVLFNALRLGYFLRFPLFWIRLTRAVPIWGRLLIGLVISLYLSKAIHEKLWMMGGSAMFLPVIASFAVSLLVMLLLFCPGKAPHKDGI